MDTIPSAELVRFFSGLFRPIIAAEFDRKLEELYATGKPVSTTAQQPSKQYVYGLAGLQELLGCSKATALKLKQSGKIPFKQIGRKLIFEVDAVLSALNCPVQKKPHRYAKSSV
ncbi:DUF3853 family protein [Dyadobacter sp. LHD-138]|uniref:DUF3853 family protein n=1 Tax=Dyadobacter sp. LHD-138 TaxID=3071413 RepID=UPI0027DF2B29|nr:DUF3853 family protein [Dyadobacter sp. LHD-138]MDQ6482344.1 DUF3853 family protein [Dyadobacter sp. LHD-138]